jgi:hypothetical protein
MVLSELLQRPDSNISWVWLIFTCNCHSYIYLGYPFFPSFLPQNAAAALSFRSPERASAPHRRTTWPHRPASPPQILSFKAPPVDPVLAGHPPDPDVVLLLPPIQELKLTSSFLGKTLLARIRWMGVMMFPLYSILPPLIFPFRCLVYQCCGCYNFCIP